MENLPERKINRLKSWDYSRKGCYFITICIRDRKCILSTICVRGGVPDAPVVELTKYGYIVDGQIKTMNEIYKNINVQHYVIMPNHIHLIIEIDNADGTSGRPSPTRSNSLISKYISAFKRFTNKKCGADLWQRSYYDHIIRNEADYMEKAEYILTNPIRWSDDEYYNNVYVIRDL